MRGKTLAACILWLANQMNAQPVPADSAMMAGDTGDSLVTTAEPSAAALSTAVGRPAAFGFPAAGLPDSMQRTLPEDTAVFARKPWEKIGFSGFMDSRLSSHDYPVFPLWMGPQAAGTSFEGRLGLKVAIAANAQMQAWSVITFASGFSGAFLNERASVHPRRVDIPGVGEAPDTVRSDETRYPSAQGWDGRGAGIFEDVAGQADFKSSYWEGSLRAGTTVWMQGSPLTLWNRETRPNPAWYHDEFEPEVSSAVFYEKRFFTREGDQGRYSWPRKPFGGVAFHALRPENGLELQLSRTDVAGLAPTRIGMPKDARAGDADGTGSSAELGAMYFGRLAQHGALAGFTTGLNAMAVELSRDLINQRIFPAGAVQGFVFQFKGGRRPYFVNPRVFTLDGRGELGPDFSLQGEAGFSMDDSLLYQGVEGSPQVYDGRSAIRHASGGPQPAAYAKLAGRTRLPFTTEVFFASPAFWSPYAMTESGASRRRDEMKLGAGGFGYQSNLAGVNLQVSPKVGGGFLILGLGQHFQVGSGRDVLQFQHVLNGREVWTANTGGARAGPGRMLDEDVPFGNPKYANRLGDLGPSRDLLYGGQQRGGLRGENREVWEEFAAYENKGQADSGKVPSHRKLATSLSIDWGVRIDPWLGAWLPMLLNLYVEANAIGTDLTALGNTEKTLLWTGLARFEPAFSLTSRLNLLGHVGIETWKSRYAWKNALYNQASPGGFNNINYYEPLSSLNETSQNAVPRVDAVAAPIDYRQLGFGAGCDWDFSARARLNLRFKYATHQDPDLSGNAWSGFFLSAGTKLWF